MVILKIKMKVKVFQACLWESVLTSNTSENKFYDLNIQTVAALYIRTSKPGLAYAHTGFLLPRLRSSKDGRTTRHDRGSDLEGVLGVCIRTANSHSNEAGLQLPITIQPLDPLTSSHRLQPSSPTRKMAL